MQLQREGPAQAHDQNEQLAAEQLCALRDIVAQAPRHTAYRIVAHIVPGVVGIPPRHRARVRAGGRIRGRVTLPGPIVAGPEGMVSVSVLRLWRAPHLLLLRRHLRQHEQALAPIAVPVALWRLLRLPASSRPAPFPCRAPLACRWCMRQSVSKQTSSAWISAAANKPLVRGSACQQRNLSRLL